MTVPLFQIPEVESHARLNAALYPTLAVEGEAPLNVIEDSRWLYDKQSWAITEYQHRPEVMITSPVRAPIAHVPEGAFTIKGRATFWDAFAQRWREGLSVIVGGAGPTPTFYE